jgi:hypothetical protein
MKPEQQRIAIAEACGWTRQSDDSIWFDDPTNSFRSFQAHEQDVPDYLADLNAMHEAEKVLTEDQAEKFRAWLLKLNGYNHDRVVSCTAPQRAVAFLKTIGKWEESR